MINSTTVHDLSVERAANIIRCAVPPEPGQAEGRGVLALADLTACPCCRDAGDELLLTVLRCPSVSAPSSALTAPFGTGEAWLDWRVGCERLAKAMRVP